ncbi:hypothetical protein LOK49_LG05G00796 [Camellia lanceoleosa]|uniref:Uncharacterized protein n=1 Tax=Camellia lanceoleosa TaxID=1840588 RepID=A0ACC0HM11_9ERIC|nr:hypothetical protein LOK49_LG05G00796 [Camellia lanceoleosa]
MLMNLNAILTLNLDLDSNLGLDSDSFSKKRFGDSIKSLSFSSTTSHNVFSTGLISMSPVVRPTRHSIICEAAPNKKADSAAKRARQAEKRRVYNKARKSEIKTRMKKAS